MDMVHAQRIATLHKAQEIIHIAAVIAMVERYPGGIDALILQDDGQAHAGAVGSMGVDAQRRPGRLAAARTSLSFSTALAVNAALPPQGLGHLGKWKSGPSAICSWASVKPSLDASRGPRTVWATRPASPFAPAVCEAPATGRTIAAAIP